MQKHQHHTIPRFYLKAFRIPDDPAFIWEYQRAKPFLPGDKTDRHNPIKRTLKRASVKGDYYGPYEDDLAQREEASKWIIEHLRTSTNTGEKLGPGPENQLFRPRFRPQADRGPRTPPMRSHVLIVRPPLGTTAWGAFYGAATAKGQVRNSGLGSFCGITSDSRLVARLSAT